ncbi:MAG: DUF4440 domain-containing protein [Gemmatimonadaceae bacterium]
MHSLLRVMLLTIVCTTAVAAQARDTADRDAEAIKSTLVQMWAAIEAGDAARYAAFVHPDFTQFGETDPYLAEGKAREVRAMTNYLQKAKGVFTEMHNPQVTIRGETAWITYYWTDEGMVDGKRMESRGKSTRIFVKENGKWLCIHGHYTLAP